MVALKSDRVVLSFSGCFLPGFKGGGPIRSIANLLSALGDEIDFNLVTSDRDLGDAEPYSDIICDRWQVVDNAMVYYAAPGLSWLFRLRKIISDFQGGVIHINGFFSFRFSILPILYWRLLKSKKLIIIGPKGEFSDGALGLKALKKRLYIALTKSLRLYRGVIWEATAIHEAEDIRRVMGDDARIRLAPNIVCPPSEFHPDPRRAGAPLRVLFVSRISPMKNLLGAIQMLQQVPCPLVLDVYGPAEDAAYWARCQEAARQLPVHVQFQYCGALYPAQVPGTMERYDLFYLPTLGENFGYVIAEALGCGLPVLIADTTPWRDLVQQKLGWDIPLSQPDQFLAAINSCSRMSAADYDAWRHRIRAWALANIGNDEVVEQNRQLFMNLDSAHEH